MSGRVKPGSRAEADELRVAMVLLGAGVESVASEVGRRFGHRPRQAWRLAHGWDQVEAAARYNSLVQSRGAEHDGRDTMTPSRISEYERWPATARRPSPYVLGTFAELYETVVVRLLDHDDLAALDPAGRALFLPTAPDRASGPRVDRNVLPQPPPRRRKVSSATTDANMEEIVSSAAEESTRAAVAAGATNVGPGTVDMLRQQVAALVVDAEFVSPVTSVVRAVAVRDAAVDLLAGRQAPDQSRDLHSVAAVACALLGWVSGDLRQHFAATSQVAAAWTFAELSGDPAAAAAVRAAQSEVSYWAGDVAGSARFADAGLRELSPGVPGTVGVLLAGFLARAAARLGDAEVAREALGRIRSERDRSGDPRDGGLISCGLVGQHCFAAGAYLTLDDPTGALAAVDAAEEAHRLGDSPSYRAVNMARVNGITAHLALGDLDGAEARMNTLSALPSDLRVSTMAIRLGRAVTLLDVGRFANDSRARALRDEITEFRRGATVARALPARESRPRA